MNPLVSITALSALFLTVAAVERIGSVQFRPAPLRRPHLATDAAWYLVATAASLVAGVVLRPVLSRFDVPGLSSAVAALPSPLRLCVAVAVFDAVATAIHMGLHRSDALWSVHKIHHSSLHLDWLATTRAHMFETMVRHVPAQAALLAIGVPATTLAAALLLYAGFALLGHSNLRLGGPRLELVFVTPRLHRLHHIPDTTQHNFGTVFTIWDRLLGRLATRDASPDERTGVPGEIDEYPQAFLAALRRPLHERRTRTRRTRRAPAEL